MSAGERKEIVVRTQLTLGSGLDPVGSSYYLVCVAGPDPGVRAEISETPLEVGRDAGAALRLRDPGLSRRHCRVVLSGGRVLVEDLGSTNGSFIADERITTRTRLPVGEILRLGDSQLRLELRERSEVLAQSRRTADLERASGYVAALLPPPVDDPRIRVDWRLHPAEQLGGDGLGYGWLGDDRFAFYVLDVSGHGAASALHSVSILNSIRKRALASVDFRDPAQVVSGLNRDNPMAEHGGAYLTIWYGVYEPALRRLRYCSAGHPPALLRSAADGAVSRLETRDIPVGMVRDHPYETLEVTVAPGSLLYCYSDGAFEVVTHSGERGGPDLIREAVEGPPRSGLTEVERVEQAVRARMRGDRFDDDFTLLIASFP
jgi:serine phosphatase RsbU (regulator of sigma subunit)